MRKVLFFLCLYLWVGAEDFKIRVGVSLAPYAYFVKKIGGDFVDIMILIPPKRNPKLYQLTYDQVKEIKELRLLITSGASYEKRWIHRFGVTNPSLQILDLSSEACREKICYSWLSFQEAKNIAQKITHQLRVIDLKNAQNYKKNLKLFLRELEEFEGELKRKITLPKTSKRVLDTEGVWKKISQEMGLDYVALQEIKPKKIDFCFITPFEIKKQITSKYRISKSNLIEINPYREDWKNLIEEFVNQVISGGKYGE